MSDLNHFGTRDCYPRQWILVVPGPVLSYPIAFGAEGPVQDHVLMVLTLNIVRLCYLRYIGEACFYLRNICRPDGTAAMATWGRA